MTQFWSFCFFTTRRGEGKNEKTHFDDAALHFTPPAARAGKRRKNTTQGTLARCGRLGCATGVERNGKRQRARQTDEPKGGKREGK
jgi:hypothetical protein